jgi:hypothetical protein
MSIAPHTGIVDFGTFTSPTALTDGIQGEVPQPLAGQENYVLTATGWAPGGGGGGSGTVTSVAATAGTGISVTGSPITTSGTLNITNTAPDRTVVLNNGTGINTTGTYPNFTIANTAPDQTVVLNNGTGISVTGTYPNFTVTNTSPSSGGTVTSVSGTGTVSGLTLSGIVTSSGNLTLGGAITGFATSGANTDITSVALTTGTISTAPSSSTDIVNKSYADSIATGINFHAACQYATTAALSTAYTYNNGTSGVGASITANAVGTLTIDGYTFVAGDVGKRILIKDEVSAFVNNTTPSAAFNGVYTLSQAGTALLPYILVRATDYDTSGTGTNEVDAGDLLLVLYGTTNTNTSWVQQTPLPITIGTTSITFIQFAAVQTYTAGTGLTLSTNQFSITNTGTAGTYGSASQVPVITTNAQGQVTGVTNTSIAISGSAVTGDISGNAANVTGTVAIGNGGTGQTTQQSALNALAGAVTSGSYLRGNGTNVVMSTIQAADVPTLNQNTSGTAAGLSSTLAIASGGTGSTTLAGASIATYTGTETLTNKRIDPRVTSAASASSITPSIATADVYAYTALAANLTINAPTGTPVDGDKLIFRLLDNGTARALTWDATYTVIGVTLPTTTTASKTTYVGCIYNANNTRWDVIAVTTQA